MAAQGARLEYYNVVVKFGDELNLLDLAEEIVLPAIETGDVPRSRDLKRASYLFHQVQTVNFLDGGRQRLGIAGRFIKATTVNREQVFDYTNNTLRQDEQSLETAPSVVFVLLLDNHKLLYLRETANSPGAESFGNTLEYFLNQQRKYLTDNLRIEIKAGRAPDGIKSVKEMLARYPSAKVTIKPLATEQTVGNALERFEVIDSVRFRLTETNEESDNRGLFAVRNLRDDVGAKTTELIHWSGKDGLLKRETRMQVNKAAAAGINEVTVTGKDSLGEDLTLTNDELKARTPFTEKFQTIYAGARLMFGIFDRLVKEETLTVEDVDDSSYEKTEQIRLRRAEGRESSQRRANRTS